MLNSKKLKFAAASALAFPVAGAVSGLALAQTPDDTPTAKNPAPLINVEGMDIDQATLDAYAAFWMAGYSFEQLEALAIEWNTSNFEAKARAGIAIQDGNTTEINAITAIVGQPAGPDQPPPPDTPDGWNEDDLDAYTAYWDAGYNYEQLLTLAEEWNTSEFEAKGRAGNAIQDGDTTEITEITAIVGQPANG